MGSARNLTFCTYNCRGHRPDRIEYIKKLLHTCDILFLQEHWLFTPNIVSFANSVGGVNIHATSGMNESELLMGRPYGGCAILWKKSLNCIFAPVESGNKRIVAGVLSVQNVRILLCNAYMPCDGNYNDPLSQTFDNVLSDIKAVIEVNTADFVVVGGDLNTDLNRSDSGRVELLADFISSQGLVLGLEHAVTSVDFTYENSWNHARSTIDHFIISENLGSSFVRQWCIHEGDNLSDHSPLFLEINIPADHVVESHSAHVPRPNWKLASDRDIIAYKMILSEELSGIDIPFDALFCRNSDCTRHAAHVDRYFEELTQCCLRAAQAAIPFSRACRRVAGWSERVAPYKDRSILWHRIWKDSGQPSSGIVFEIMKKSKAEYKQAAKSVLRRQNQVASRKMGEALADSKSRDFCSEVRRHSSKRLSTPDRVDEAQGSQAICDLFADKYSELYNSVSYDMNAMSELIKEVAESSRVVCDRGACYSSHQFVVREVRDAVLKLKASKSDSEEQFMSDHVIHGGDALLVHLSFLFNCMLSHTVVPKQMLIAVLIPITKNRRKSLYDSSNYRSIALSSIIGKVFDRIVLNLHGHIFSTSNLQFGFKPKHSTTECTFVLNHVMQHYSKWSTQCYVLLLDASKAFDRVEYVRLFSMLRQRGLCSKLCLLLAQLYSNQSMSVRWKTSISRQFQCRNGVKQGGVLSPTLFCIFFDELLRMLENSGVGCYLGHRFMGALSYADDVALIAPTITAARMMLRVCEDFASRYKVLFNAEKSVLLRPVSPAEGELVLNGRKIKENSSAIHLGTCIGANSSKANIQKAVSDLYCATNTVMSKFGHCSCIVLNKLFESFCTSFFGSPLWCVVDIDPLVTAWRKCVKRVWKLNMRTRTKYFTLL